MTKIMFETFAVPAMNVCVPAVLALFGSGLTTGVVLDSGHTVTCVVPINEGQVIPHAIHHLGLGGRDISGLLRKMLGERDISVDSSSSTHREIVNDMKENRAYIALNFEEEMHKFIQAPDLVEMPYSLSDGNVIVMGSERFRCSEALFQPALLGLAICSIRAHPPPRPPVHQ